jgi:hypothetical protein
MTDRLQTVAEDLDARGFDVTREGNDLLASGGSLPAVDVDAALQVSVLRNSRPLTVVSAVATAAEAGRLPVLAADPTTADAAGELLDGPFGLAAAEPERVFQAVEDRILLRDDTYACVPAGGRLRWREEAPASASDRGSDSPQLLLERDGETVAVLDSVDGLACPGPSAAAFPYRYDREQGGQVRVFDADGLVGRYPSMTAMKEAYRPVPLPLVPEHHIRANSSLARAAVLVRVADGVVDYERCR